MCNIAMVEVVITLKMWKQRINDLLGNLIAHRQQSQAVYQNNQTLHNAAMLNASSLIMRGNQQAKFIYKVLKMQID